MVNVSQLFAGQFIHVDMMGGCLGFLNHQQYVHGLIAFLYVIYLSYLSKNLRYI